MEKVKKYRYKTVTIDDRSSWHDYSSLEKMLEEEGWEIYQSGVNTILKEKRGDVYDNNITRFILRKEKEE